jgi:hypothetical protein
MWQNRNWNRSMRHSFVSGILALAVTGAVVPAHAQVGIYGQPSSAPVASTPAKFEPAGDKVYHGASLPNTWDENGLRSQIQAYNAAAGKKLSVITWFASTYENGRMTTWSQSYATALARVKRAGALSLIKFSTQDYAYTNTRRAADLKQIALGAWDDYFKDAAQTVKNFGSPVFISIDHEMNGNWYPYSQSYPNSGVTAGDYIAAWRRVVDIFRANGANNAAFVWSPNVPDVSPGLPFSAYYPGDNYTDWIGVSFYSGNMQRRSTPFTALTPPKNPSSSPNGLPRPKRAATTRASLAKRRGFPNFSTPFPRATPASKQFPGSTGTRTTATMYCPAFPIRPKFTSRISPRRATWISPSPPVAPSMQWR